VDTMHALMHGRRKSYKKEDNYHYGMLLLSSLWVMGKIKGSR